MLDHIVPTLAQILFFPFSLVVFGRLDKATATAVVVLVGLCFLPDITIFRLHDAVLIHKDRIIYLGALFGMLVHQSRAFMISRPGMTVAAVLIPLMIVNIFTWQSNLNPMFSQGTIHSGLSLNWLIAETIDNFFRFALPFAVAKAAFTSHKDLRSLLYLLVGMGIIYTAFILIELVLAIPFRIFQFSERIYGVPFRTLFRFGFTEPVVFLSRGHTVATFMLMAFIAAAGFSKIGKPVSWAKIKQARIITGIGLVATLKVGASMMGVGAVMIIALFKPRKIAFIAALSAALLCVYPATQVFDLFPEDALVELATKFTHADRVKSFRGRFEEEEFVLEGLGDRLFVGWGHYGRIPGGNTRIATGAGETGLDGWWVIKLGTSGFFGVEIAYLLMAIPVLKARKHIASLQSDETILMLGALMMCIVVRMADLILNGWWNSLPVFLAGALYGICKYARQLLDDNTSSDDEPQKKRNQQ